MTVRTVFALLCLGMILAPPTAAQVATHTLTSPNPGASGFSGFFGFSVSGVPDADGDGRGDLLVGAPSENVAIGASGAGRAYLLSGATGALLRTLVSPNPPFRGLFGISVSGVPNTAGDGRGGLLIGASSENGGTPGSGRAHSYATQTRPVSLAGPQGWRLLAVPLASGMADLLAETWTQGAAGADISDGDPNVFTYAETSFGVRSVGYTALPDLRTADRTGQGRAVFVFEDNDLVTPGIQGGFPKSLAVNGHTRAGHPAAFPVTFTASGPVQEDGWNLVGNPFDLNLDWDVAGWTKTNVDNTIYVYDRVAGVFKSWNGTVGSLGDGVVAEFQGFWVKANSASPVLVAPAAARVATAPPQTPRGTALGLRLAGTVGTQAVADEAFVTFIDGAAAALDPFDAFELASLDGTAAALYTDAGGTLLDVDARAPLAEPAVFQIGASAALAGRASGGAFTLSWPDLAGVPLSWRLTLTDTESGETVDLRARPSYSFTLAPGLTREAGPAETVLAPPVPTALAFVRADGAAARPAAARFLLRVEAATTAAEEAPRAEITLAVAPNPTAGRARLAYTLPAAASVRLVLVDALGREVAVVADGERAAGRHDALVDAGGLAPGVYALRLSAGGLTVTRRLTVVSAR